MPPKKSTKTTDTKPKTTRGRKPKVKEVEPEKVTSEPKKRGRKPVAKKETPEPVVKKQTKKVKEPTSEFTQLHSEWLEKADEIVNLENSLRKVRDELSQISEKIGNFMSIQNDVIEVEKPKTSPKQTSKEKIETHQTENISDSESSESDSSSDSDSSDDEDLAMLDELSSDSDSDSDSD